MERSCSHNESIRFTVHTLSNRLKCRKQHIDIDTHTHTVQYSTVHSFSIIYIKHKKVWVGKIDAQAIFIAWCAEISTLSRSTFMGQRKWDASQNVVIIRFHLASFVFFFFFFFAFFPHSNFLFACSLFSCTVLQIWCRFFYCSLCSIASFGRLKRTKYYYTTLKMFLHLRTYFFFQLPFHSGTIVLCFSFFILLLFRIGTMRCKEEEKKTVSISIYNFFIIFQYYHTFYGLFNV